MEARIDNYHTWVEGGDHVILNRQVENLLIKSGFTILNFMEHRFDPQGYTALWLLAESHCALHTFPEQGKSYIELSSCNLDMYNRFIELVPTIFKLAT